MERSLLIIMSVLITVVVAHDQQNDVCGFGETPNLIHRFPEGRPVYGVQPIGSEIYVIRDSTPYIEIFDRSTFQPKRNISVEDLEGPYDMVQSRSDSSAATLFIANWFNAVNLTKIQPGLSQPTVDVWSFLEQNLTTLGLTGSSFYTGQNILVTSSTSQKVKEFTPNGNLVNEVTVRNISRPRQSIKVASDRYAVCYGYGPPPELHQVCLVDGDGETINCYGGVQGSGVGQLNTPGRLELTKKNCILVADTRNKRVVLLNQTLDYVRNLINEDLDGPYRLYIDQEQNLLFVADNTADADGYAVSGRVLVFKFNETRSEFNETRSQFNETRSDGFNYGENIRIAVSAEVMCFFILLLTYLF